MILGRYKQQAYDRRKRGIDFTDFLEDAEKISAVNEVIITPVTDPPLVIDQVILDPAGKKIAYYVTGGENGQTYLAEFRTSTTLAQKREDGIEFEIEED
jgi:hypothetical protein